MAAEKKPKVSENTWRRDVQLLYRASLALSHTTPRMRRPSLEFLWDKYVTHAFPDPPKPKTKRGKP